MSMLEEGVEIAQVKLSPDPTLSVSMDIAPSNEDCLLSLLAKISSDFYEKEQIFTEY